VSISELHPNVRTFHLPSPCYLPIGFDGIATALLTAHVASGLPFSDNEHEWTPGGRLVDVRIEFLAPETPLERVNACNRWFVRHGTWFLWPENGEQLAILVHLKKAKLEGKPAARILSIERFESLAVIS
jgi:hypothetical protein